MDAGDVAGLVLSFVCVFVVFAAPIGVLFLIRAAAETTLDRIYERERVEYIDDTKGLDSPPTWYEWKEWKQAEAERNEREELERWA